MRRLLMPVIGVGLLATGVVLGVGQVGVPDRDLSLRRTDVKDDRAPRPFVFVEDAPGGNALLPRSYDGAPPLVPHALDGLVPITREDNMCLLCHATGSTDPADPPQAPRSHFIDWRAAPDVVRDTVSGARWTCTSCHVPQTDAPPLVGNTFSARGR